MYFFIFLLEIPNTVEYIHLILRLNTIPNSWLNISALIDATVKNKKLLDSNESKLGTIYQWPQ